MTAVRLDPRRIEKPWGGYALAPWTDDVSPGDPPIGELWFELEPGSDLLAKLLVTTEKLSIQVHPDDRAARARGEAWGKDEAWLVLAADPEAKIGLGLTAELSIEQVRAAAIDGSLECLVDWKRVRPGDFFYSPAGTIHAIGAGVTILEIQQNLDLTYRLFDYGRPRELHLDEGLAVAKTAPWREENRPRASGPGRTVMSEGPSFVVEKWQVAGSGCVGGAKPLWLALLDEGEVWYIDGDTEWDFGSGTEALVAYSSSAAIAGLWKPD